jgi:hypothetical protein
MWDNCQQKTRLKERKKRFCCLVAQYVPLMGPQGARNDTHGSFYCQDTTLKPGTALRLFKELAPAKKLGNPGYNSKS